MDGVNDFRQSDADAALLTRIDDFIRVEMLWRPGAHLLVAVSGGPDSVALLHLLCASVAPRQALRLSVAHVHHGLRAEAEDDARFVEEMAARLGLAYLLSRVDVPARVAATGESVEEAARHLRYAALAEMAREAGAAVVVTGHTADDQAETVLMRVLRGAGVAGLAGIPAKRGQIVRPLLPIRRSEIEAYVRRHGLPFRTDGSNACTDFTRNRLRLELLPLLEAAYAPRLRERLVQLGQMARQDEQALALLAEQYYARCAENLPDGVAIPLEPAVPAAISSRVWRRAIAEVRGSLDEIDYAHIAAIAALPARGEVHVPGVRVFEEAGRLVFLAGTPVADQSVIAEQVLPIPACLDLPAAHCRLRVAELAGRVPLAGGDRAVLDAQAVNGELTVRGWRPGDRYRPLGAPGSRKLQDIFVDAGVPRRWRERIPLISDTEGIIWLAGFRLADRVKVIPATTRSLQLIIEWEWNPWTLPPSPTAPAPNWENNFACFAPPDA